MNLAPDTRKLLKVGSILILTGAIAAALMLTLFGGITRQGPHTNLGWMALIVTMGCLPLGCITLLLGAAKLFGSHNS
jgi:hypothetical protein